MSLYAYNGDFYNFINHYNIDSHNSYMNGCVCRGIVFNLDFCRNILNCTTITFPDFVYKVAYSKLIMNDVVDVDAIKKYKPFCIWYPQVPSRETCLKLCSIGGDIVYSVSIVSILMNWKDIFSECRVVNDKFLCELGTRCGRDWVPFGDLSRIDLINEDISESNYSTTVTNFFQFKKDVYNNIFSIGSYGVYKYEYPLGLGSLYLCGFEFHMINRNNPTYIHNDEELFECESDDDY